MLTIPPTYLFVDDSIFEYIVKLTEMTRDPQYFALGLSPRGSIALLKMAKAHAYVQDRGYVLPEDIHDIWHAVAGHRVRLGGQAKASGISVTEALNRVLGQVEIPKIN